MLDMKHFMIIAMMLVWAMSSRAEDCKPDDFSSFNNVKEAVRGVIQKGMLTGFDDKLLSRSGDMTALAILKTIPDAELTKSDTIPRVLDLLRLSFSCLSRCVETCSDREPRVTLLLLDHLHEVSKRRVRKQVEEIRKLVLHESYKVWPDTPIS